MKNEIAGFCEKNSTGSYQIGDRFNQVERKRLFMNSVYAWVIAVLVAGYFVVGFVSDIADSDAQAKEQVINSFKSQK